MKLFTSGNKNSKILLGFLLLMFAVLVPIFISFQVHGNKDLLGGFIELVPPPPVALAGNFGVPLETSNIGLIAYYEASSWTLANVIPAFQNYTEYTNYIDGYIRVHSNVRSTTFVGSVYCHTEDEPTWIDVQVRVRADGWILAWLTETQNKAFILHWGDDVKGYQGTGDPVDAITTPTNYHTCLSRAIHRVYHNAGVSWIGYDEVRYYDYQYEDATRLYVFGDYTQSVFPNAEDNSEEFWFIVPDSVEIEHAILSYAGHNSSGDDIDIDYVDRATIGWGVEGTGWRELDITSFLTEGTRHYVYLHNGGSGQGESIACGIVMWTS